MKTSELFEGEVKRGVYYTGHYPGSSDFGLQHLYNNVVPALSRIFKVPTVSIKLQQDHGYGWSNNPRLMKMFGTEKFFVQVIFRRKGYDIDLITKMLPKALKSELAKQLDAVEVELVKVEPETQDAFGKRVPPYAVLRATTKYPQEWLERGKRRWQQ